MAPVPAARIVLNRSVRVLGYSVVATPLVYGFSELLIRILPSHWDSKAIDVTVFLIGVVCLFLQLGALILPCAALALLAVAAAYVWHSHVAIVPIAAFILAGAMFSVGSWLKGLYGLDPPYIPYFLGSAMQLVAMVTPVLALGWVVVHVVRRTDSSAAQGRNP
jgi:hypothetical protein